MAEQAIAVADSIIEGLPAPRNAAEEGMLEGSVLLRDTIRVGQRALDRDGDLVDRKLLSLSCMMALGLMRLGGDASERRTRSDLMGKLLAAIEAEKTKP